MYNLPHCESIITPQILDNINNCIINLGNPAGLLPYELLTRIWTCSRQLINITECIRVSYIVSRILRRYHYNVRRTNDIAELQVNEVLNLKFNVPTEYHYLTITRINENTFRIYNAWGNNWIVPFDVSRNTWINNYNVYLQRIQEIGEIPTIGNAIIFNDLLYDLTHHQLNILTKYNDAPDDDDDIDLDEDDDDDVVRPPIYTKEELLEDFFRPIVSDAPIIIDIYSMPEVGLGYKRKHLKKRKTKTKTKKNTKNIKKNKKNTKRKN